MGFSRGAHASTSPRVFLLVSVAPRRRERGQRNPTSCCSQGSWQLLWFAGGAGVGGWTVYSGGACRPYVTQAGTVLWITAGILREGGCGASPNPPSLEPGLMNMVFTISRAGLRITQWDLL